MAEDLGVGFADFTVASPILRIPYIIASLKDCEVFNNVYRNRNPIIRKIAFSLKGQPRQCPV
jgi:hypothetical protein